MAQDEEHLRLLSIFHYVVAGVAGLFATFPVIHVIIGLICVLAPDALQGQGGPPPPPWFGWLFVIVGSAFILLGWTFAAFVYAAGRSLAKRKRYTFCLVVAGVECMLMPIGTVLGAPTIVVLMRESVKQRFDTGN